MFAFFKGNRTYAVALGLLVYTLGGALAWWDFDEKVVAALLAGAVASLRAGMK